MSLIYFILGILSLVASLIVVSALNPIHRVGYLVIVFLIGAFLFMLLDFYFLGLVYIIVYVGAIAILFLFIIMMVECNTITKISPFIPLRNKKSYSTVNFQNSQKKNVSLLNLSIVNKASKKIINVLGLNTDITVFGGAYAPLKRLSGENQSTGNPVSTIDLSDIAISTLFIKENLNQYPNLFENSITTIFNDIKWYQPLAIFSKKKEGAFHLFLTQELYPNLMSKLKIPIIIMFILLLNMDNEFKFLFGIESLFALYHWILFIFPDNQIMLTIIIFVVNLIYYINLIVMNLIHELLTIKLFFFVFKANLDNNVYFILDYFLSGLHDFISLMSKFLSDFFYSNELLKTYHIYAYFSPIWAIEFLNLTDLETLGIMTYVAYPVALILIGLTLWAVMIGIISICSPRR